MKDPQERYLSDPAFKMLVDSMEIEIQRCNYSPSELREAALLAAIHYEQRHCRSLFTIQKEAERSEK